MTWHNEQKQFKYYDSQMLFLWSVDKNSCSSKGILCPFSCPYNMGEWISWLRLSVHRLCLHTTPASSHLLRLLGLCNNFAYVVMLSAAHDILKKQESGNSTATVRTVLLFAVIAVTAWALIWSKLMYVLLLFLCACAGFSHIVFGFPSEEQQQH